MLSTPRSVSTVPDDVDVDGLLDPKGVRYLGTARRLSGDLYVCLAEVDGCLCRVEVRITSELRTTPAPPGVRAIP